MARSTFTAVCLLVFMACAACKGCGDPCADVACGDGQACQDGVCLLNTTPCDPACTADQVCEDAVCVTPPAQCEASGDECDANRPAGNGFTCLDLDGFGLRPGQCVAPCDENGGCPTTELCFYLTAAADPACSTEADCGEGRDCSQGACRQTICRPSECSGFIEGVSTCQGLYSNITEFSIGAQCYEVGNGARYCYPAGSRTVGESCGDVIEAITTNNFAPTCASGLACVDDVCRLACHDDDICVDGEECILEEVDLIDDATGICGNACTPFELGSCGPGQTCLPVTADEGVCATAGTRSAFEPCVPGAGECADGNLCITYQNDPVAARCQPMCNLTVAPPNDDGSVGEFAQSQRDATCPQSESVGAWFAVTNLAEIGGAIDVYVGDAMTPLMAALPLDARSDSDAASPGAQWTSVLPGSSTVRILPAGAPRTDPPLAEQTVSFVADGATEMFVLPVAGALDDATLVLAGGSRALAPPAAGSASVRVMAALADQTPIDVVLVPPGDDLSVPANQFVLAASAPTATVGAFVDALAQDWDLLVFAAGDPRTDRATALVAAPITLTDGQIATLAVRGTVDPDDLPVAGAVLVDIVAPPPLGQGGPAFTCVDIQAGAFGFCQQSCGNASEGFAGVCEGEGMGCHPSFLRANNAWASLCAPLGDKPLDATCDPFGEFSECGEGLYCLEYGNTVPDYSALVRGRCASLCVDGTPADPVLSCPGTQACKPISIAPNYRIGQCGFPCEPSRTYGDVSCPLGLKSCKPAASLLEDAANPDALPTPVVTASFCSASGDIATGATCTANDCVAGSECMFPRSAQTDFTSTLLSQYFGAAGLVPSCTPQCDPFEGDSSSTTCAADETCLFNFPYSAEVGHCAPVTVDLEPLQPCSNPGHACGKDSICVVNGTPTCFQFCQYTGPDAAGQPRPETCAAGFFCSPLVNDVGVCLSP